MAHARTFVEYFKVVNGTPVATTNGGIDCDIISCKDALKVTILIEFLQAATNATSVSLVESLTVAGTTTSAVTATSPWWKNADVSSTDTLVRQTDAAAFTATAGTTNQEVIIEWDPAKHTGETSTVAPYDCIQCVIATSSESGNFATVTYFIEERYKQATPPAAITD